MIYPLGEYFILSSRGNDSEPAAKCGNYFISKKSKSLVIDINFKERKLEKIIRYLYYELNLVENI